MRRTYFFAICVFFIIIMTSLYTPHNVFILIYAKLYGPMATASWITGWKPLIYECCHDILYYFVKHNKFCYVLPSHKFFRSEKIIDCPPERYYPSNAGCVKNILLRKPKSMLKNIIIHVKKHYHRTKQQKFHGQSEWKQRIKVICWQNNFPLFAKLRSMCLRHQCTVEGLVWIAVETPKTKNVHKMSLC